MASLPKTIVAVDVETTGLSSDDRIVTLGAWRVNSSDLFDDNLVHTECLHIIANPGKKSHPRAIEVHGYSDWVLKYQQPFSENAQIAREFLASGDVVIAHNASFDLGFISREYLALGQATPAFQSYCTMNQYRHAGHSGSASLKSICQELGLSRIGKTHGALEDSWLALMVYYWLNQIPSKCIKPFEVIAREKIPIIPYNFREPPPEPSDVRRNQDKEPTEIVKLSKRSEIKKSNKASLLRQMRPTAILLLEVARASNSIATEEIEILVSAIRATRDRLGFDVDDDSEREIVAELFEIKITQNILTRAARALCEDLSAREAFPKLLAGIATVDGEISESERAAIERVKSAISRIKPHS